MTSDELVQRLIDMGIRHRGDPILTTNTEPSTFPSTLRRLGWLDIQGRKITIRDMEGLRRRATH